MDEVTATQAALLSGVSERTIRRRIAAGQLPARRVAPNRFAIKIEDLPINPGLGDLAGRLEALERRVAAIELRQQALLRTQAASTPAPVGDVSLSQLHALLAELTRETERLAPLLGATQPPAEEETGIGSRNVRPLRRGRQAARQG